MTAVSTEETLTDFLAYFCNQFQDYAKHEVLSWYLRNCKTAVFNPEVLPSHIVRLVIDFGQNLVLRPQHETSEQYFYKIEEGLHAGVAGIGNKDDLGQVLHGEKGHKITLCTTSDEKTKDAHWVFCSLDDSLPRVLAWCATYRHTISIILLKTDRAGNEYINATMVETLRMLAAKYQVTFIHFTEQSCHNKDEADGEFARIKVSLR